MNKLSLDQIGFIKHKLQQLIVLPLSPAKEQLPPQNIDNSKFFKSPNKSKITQTPRKNNHVVNQISNENKKWLAKKQNDILQYITHQNRNRESILNKFLNSDKIHLKKREEVDKEFQSKQAQKIRQNQKDESQNFSFDDGSTSPNKAQKINQNFIKNKNDPLQKDDSWNKNQNQSADNSQHQLINILKNMKQKPQKKQQEKENKKPIFLIETQDILVKPSTLKGKLLQIKHQQVQTPKISNNTFGNKKKTSFNFENSVPKDNQGKKKGNYQSVSKKNLNIDKSDSQVSLQKRKKSSSFANVKAGNQENKSRRRSISKNDRNFIHNISGSLSKNSFEFFDSERPSTIKPPPNLKDQNMRYRRQSIQFQSPSKSQNAISPKKFLSSVYKKSFKENPYELTSHQKFYINKYRSKEISPEERRNLKQKYELLDKRLIKILQAVKNQKQSVNQCFSSSQIEQKQLPRRKVQIPQQILFYQKFSPLKKVLKVNKQLKMKFNGDDI